MPAACRSSCRTAAAHRGELRPAGDQPRDLAAGGARHRRAFHRGVQRHVVVPLSRRRLVQAPARHADRQRARADIPVAREERGDAIILRASHDGYADRFSVIHQRALKLALDRQPRRRRGPVRGHRRRHAFRRTSPDEFAVRFHLHPVGQGQQADRRPRRHADAAEPRGLDLQRLRGPRRARGERLSRPAPTGRAAPCRS